MPEARKSGAGRAQSRPGKSRKRCKYVDSMAEHSGDGTDGGDDDYSSEEETLEDKTFIDDEVVGEKRRRLPRVSAAEKVVSEDELENLTGACLELCSGPSLKKKRTRKHAYADADDLDAATKSDEDFLASSSGEEEEEELQRTGRAAKKALDAYLESEGVALSAKAKKPSVLTAEAHKAARKNAFENTMSFLRAKSAQGGAALPLLTGRQSQARVRPTEAFRHVAPVFLGGGGKKPVLCPAARRPPPGSAPGLVLDPATKAVHYRHPDGRLSPRPGAL